MDKRDIIIILVVILIIVFVLQNKSEHLDTSSLSTEAIQNIASVYSDTKGEVVFNNVKVTGNADIGNFKGIIVMWSGSNIPSGWALCDGTNGTPDLRGRFVLGSGKGTDLTERKINDKDGEENHTLIIEEMTPHTHLYAILTGREDGAHAKQDTGYTDESTNKRTGFGAIGELFSLDASNQAANRYYNYTSISGGILDNQEKKNELTSHKAKPHNNMPPFYVLAYIMKL
jgi:microcystin-dependent protein